MTIGIVTAAVLIPIVALVAIYCCWRRQKQNRLFGKAAAMSSCVTGDSDGGPRRRFSLEGTFCRRLGRGYDEDMMRSLAGKKWNLMCVRFFAC